MKRHLFTNYVENLFFDVHVDFRPRSRKFRNFCRSHFFGSPRRISGRGAENSKNFVENLFFDVHVDFRPRGRKFKNFVQNYLRPRVENLYKNDRKTPNDIFSQRVSEATFSKNFEGNFRPRGRKFRITSGGIKKWHFIAYRIIHA